MPIQFAAQGHVPFMDYTYEGYTFRVLEGLTIMGQWCSVCKRFETFEFELGIFVATESLESHNEAVGRCLLNIWQNFSFLKRSAEIGQHELKEVLKNRLMRLVKADGTSFQFERMR